MEKANFEMEEPIQKVKLEQAEKKKMRQYHLRMKELEMCDTVGHFDVTHPTRNSISRKRS